MKAMLCFPLLYSISIFMTTQLLIAQVHLGFQQMPKTGIYLTYFSFFSLTAFLGYMSWLALKPYKTKVAESFFSASLGLFVLSLVFNYYCPLLYTKDQILVTVTEHKQKESNEGAKTTVAPSSN